MEIGKLNKRITFQKFATTVNENGFEVQEWVTFSTVWANIGNLFGKEYYAAAAVQEEKTVKFTVRYIKDLDTDMRILFDEKYYNITFINDINYAHKFLEVKAMLEVI